MPRAADGPAPASARGAGPRGPERRRPHRSGDRRRRRARNVAQQRRRHPPVAASGADRPRQQPARDRVEDPDAGRQPEHPARDVGRDTGGRAADVVFGLGNRPGADAVRVLWPSGILQAETVAEPTLPSPLRHRGAGSKTFLVPLPLYLEWRALRVRHRLHGRRRDGVLGRPGQAEHAGSAGVRAHHAAISCAPKDGRFEIRVTNELEETLFADRFQLLAIAHPRDVEVYPNEGHDRAAEAVPAVRGPRRAGYRARSTTRPRRDRSDRARSIGGIPTTFALERFRGYAAPHTLTLDLGAGRRRPAASSC